MPKCDLNKVAKLIAFSQLFLGDAKVNILLISWHFWWFFGCAPSHLPPSQSPPICVWFFGRNPQKFGENGLKFWSVMQCKVIHQACDIFYFILKKTPETEPKNPDFLAHFEMFFDYALLHPPSYAPLFCQIKVLMVIHNRGMFHQHSICGSKCSIHEMGPFRGFSGPFLSQIRLII